VARSRLRTRWREYRPSKALYFWSCLTCIAGTIALALASGGWVTAGEASRMTDAAVRTARAQLAADYCVGRFESSAGAASDLAKLKETEGWRQDDFVVKRGWVTPPGSTVRVSGAAGICVQRLMVEKLPLGEAASAPTAQPVKTGG